MGKVESTFLDALKLVYPDLLQPVARDIGQSLSTIVRFILIPLQWLRYADEVVRLRFKARLEKTVEALNRIPIEERIEPPSSVAAPVIEKLAIESDEDISFINLLTNASSSRTVHLAHPSFINCISSISNDETKLLLLFRDAAPIPFLRIRMIFDKENGIIKSPMLTGIENRTELTYPENLPVYLENIIGLGILRMPAGKLTNVTKYYRPIAELYKVVRQEIYSKGHEDGNRYEVVFVPGYLEVTEYGQLFIRACMKNY